MYITITHNREIMFLNISSLINELIHSIIIFQKCMVEIDEIFRVSLKNPLNVTGLDIVLLRSSDSDIMFLLVSNI